MLWFDNGVDQRYLDPLKLRIAAYYYNRAREWGKEVTLSTKKAAYAPSNKNTETIGSLIDFEKIGARSPSGIRTGEWQVDEPIGSTWGYTSDMNVAGPGAIISRLADTVSKNGTLLLNLSPKADGTFPREQQDTLLGVGQWLDINGEAIYGTHNWVEFREGGERGSPALNVRFTVKNDSLYAIIIGNWPGSEAVITSLAAGKALEGKIAHRHFAGQRRRGGIHPRRHRFESETPRRRSVQICVCSENHRTENESTHLDAIRKSSVNSLISWGRAGEADFNCSVETLAASRSDTRKLASQNVAVSK